MEHVVNYCEVATETSRIIVNVPKNSRCYYDKKQPCCACGCPYYHTDDKYLKHLQFIIYGKT